MYNPQTYGQARVMKKGLKCYLLCFPSDRPRGWTKWLSLAKNANSTFVHSSSLGRHIKVHKTYVRKKKRSSYSVVYVAMSRLCLRM